MNPIRKVEMQSHPGTKLSANQVALCQRSHPGIINKMYYWNPEQQRHEATGMLPYLRSRLPDDLNEMIGELQQSR